ncbi:MAG: glycosyltransferase family 2 protein, partial [Gemmataceae bacterium]
MTPPLTVLIPCRHRSDLLDRCLASVRRFSPPSTQILVVDDGGVDPGVAQACVRHGVERIELPGHSGFCRAMNQGLAHARGEIVEFLNDDTVVTAGWIEQAIRHFRDPAIAAVCPL